MHIPPNWGTFGILIASFLVFWAIFSRLFFGPFLEVISNREKRFRSLSERTEQLLKEAREADAAREERINAARHESLQQRETERRKIETEAAKMVEEAKADARNSLESTRARIEDELKAAQSELERTGQMLAAQLAERVLGRPLNGGGPSQ